MRRYWSSSGSMGRFLYGDEKRGEVDAEEQAAIASKT